MSTITIQNTIFYIETLLPEHLSFGFSGRQIGTTNGLVYIRPNKSTGKQRRACPMAPHIFQCGTLSLVVLAMKELGRHEYLLSVVQAISTGLVSRIVMSVYVTKITPRMHHMSVLDIQLAEERIYRTVPSSFVTITPYKDTRIIYITLHHFVCHSYSCCIIVMGLPSGQFIEIEQAQRIAHFQEMTIRRIMASNGIHIHLFQQQAIFQTHRLTKRATGFWMETMSIGSFHQKFGTIQINTVVRTNFDGAEPYFLSETMSVTQSKGSCIEIGMLGVPCFRIGIHPTSF